MSWSGISGRSGAVGSLQPVPATARMWQSWQVETIPLGLFPAKSGAATPPTKALFFHSLYVRSSGMKASEAIGPASWFNAPGA